MSVLPSPLDLQEAALHRALAELHTCLPAEVVAVRAADGRQFVDALPMLQRAVVDEDGVPQDEPLPLLQMVPVGYMQGGGFFLSLPLRPGDVVLVVFAERSLDAWIQTAKPGARTPVVPGDLAMHSLQGAIALPCCPRPRGALLQGVHATDMVVGTDSGTILARFRADGSVSFAEGVGADFVALAGKVDGIIAKLDGVLRNWVVAPQDGGLALQNAYKLAFPSAPASVAATKTKAT